MELSSKVNDKLFVEWTKDDKLFPRMHSYGSLKDLMKERAQPSVDFQHFAASRGSTSGRTASSRYQEKQRDKKKDTSFSGGPSSGGSAPKADIPELLSQCHSMIAELRVSEREGKGDKGGKGSGKGKGRGRGKGQGGRGGKAQMHPNALIAEFKARIQCKHCGKTNLYSDHCFEIQRKQKEDRLKTFLIQSGLIEEAPKRRWKTPRRNGRTRSKRDRKLAQERQMHRAPPQQMLVLAPPQHRPNRCRRTLRVKPRKGREIWHFQRLRKSWTCFEPLSRTVSHCDYPWLWRRRCVTLFRILVQFIPLWLYHWCQIRIAGGTVQSRWETGTTHTIKETNPWMCAWAISIFLMFVSLWKLQLFMYAWA